jgi:MOSC domain-containing protein YiiM
MPAPPEICGACRFDSSQYDLADTLGTQRALGPMWRQATEGQAADILDARPAPQVWSATEYASHSADVVAGIGRLLHGLLTFGALRLDPPPPTGASGSEPADAAIGRLAGNLTRLEAKAAAFGAGSDERWTTTADLGDEVLDAASAVRHAVHEVSHHLMDVGRGLHLLGAGAPTQEGSVAQLNASDGGVPKTPVKVAEVGDRGLLGDRQADRRHHGRPLQALCLWSVEVIDALRAQGHPIHPGAAGENITLTGIDWTTVRPGTQILLGNVLVEVSAWSTPCAKNAPWFADGDFTRIDHELHPGWSRAYAWVREPGTLRPGDPAIVEP